MLGIERLENGNLLLTVPNHHDRAYLLEKSQDGYTDVSLWVDLLEPYFTNGEYHPVNPEVHNFGITSDPFLIVEEATLEDDFTLTCVGGHWCYNDFALRSPIDLLITGAPLILHLWHYAENPETRYPHDYKHADRA